MATPSDEFPGTRRAAPRSPADDRPGDSDDARDLDADFAEAGPDDTQDDAPLYDRPSKSQVKRDMHALLDLGKRLVDLSTDQLKRLPLSEKLYEAIREAQRTTSREGRRRQIHYVGKLMRQAPAQAIQAQLHEWENGSRASANTMHRLEAMRDQLMADDQALTRLIDEYPQADARILHGLVRNARLEARKNSALPQGVDAQRKHYRALFQALKQLDGQAATEADPQAHSSDPDED